MDLMRDIGLFDQLSSAREENKVLSAKVKELAEEMKAIRVENYALVVQNQALLAEVEEYRREATHLNFSKISLTDNTKNTEKEKKNGDPVVFEADHFIKSGNGIFPSQAAASLKNLHGIANPLCCALHPADDSLLVTGGADSSLRLCLWGAALAPDADSSARVVHSAPQLHFSAPVISTSFLCSSQIPGINALAVGLMDGSVHFASYDRVAAGAKTNLTLKSLLNSQVIDDDVYGNSKTQPHNIKHSKYVKNLAWSPSEPILASASSDGTVRLTKVISIIGNAVAGGVATKSATASMSIDEDDEEFSKCSKEPEIVTKEILTLHLPGPVEAMAFLNNGDVLCCYVRGTSYLSYFDLRDDCKQTKYSINGGSLHDDHVSFTIMSLHPSPIEGGKYLAAATDSSRNIIFEAGTPRQIRNLYGHQNDSYSNAKIAWSSSGQYLFGNTQEDCSVCVWDIASSSIVKRSAGHEGAIRDIFSSTYSDTLATVSYDKTVKIWLNMY